MTKESFKILTKSYIRNYNRNDFTAEELIGLLKLSKQLLIKQCGEQTPMFRFGNDSTILYTIDNIEKDLLHSTKENKEFLQEQIKHACEVREIIIT